MQITKFTAFYPSRPYFAVDSIDFTNPRIEVDLTSLMEEEVFFEKNDKFALKICRDGRILIRISELESDKDSNSDFDLNRDVNIWGEYLDFLNSFYLLLDSAMIQIDRFAYFMLHEITNGDAFRVTYKDGKWSGENIATESIASKFQEVRWAKNYNSNTSIKSQGMMSRRHVVSLEVIWRACEDFAKVVAGPGSQKDISKFAKSISEFKVGNYETSIVLSWFIIEAAIFRVWLEHLDGLNCEFAGGEKRINKDRKNLLIGRDFSASIVSNILELTDVIDFKFFKNIDAVRKLRNDIAHSLESEKPTADQARLAMETAQTMIEKTWGISIAVNYSYSISGL